jgi:hypothetical protein
MKDARLAKLTEAKSNCSGLLGRSSSSYIHSESKRHSIITISSSQALLGFSYKENLGKNRK